MNQNNCSDLYQLLKAVVSCGGLPFDYAQDKRSRWVEGSVVS